MNDSETFTLTDPDADPFFDNNRLTVLATALKERFDMSEEDANEIATTVAAQFGANAEVNDENLESTVRSIFYTLEAKKILSFRREEYTWETGERRRGYWWRFREEEFLARVEAAAQEVELDVYDALPRDAWARQNA